jgi:hypothetical protein
MLLCKNAQEFNMENSNVIFLFNQPIKNDFLYRSTKILLFFNQSSLMHVNVLKKGKFQLVQIQKMNQMMMVRRENLPNNYPFYLFLEPLKKRVKKESSTKKVNRTIPSSLDLFPSLEISHSIPYIR